MKCPRQYFSFHSCSERRGSSVSRMEKPGKISDPAHSPRDPASEPPPSIRPPAPHLTSLPQSHLVREDTALHDPSLLLAQPARVVRAVAEQAATFAFPVVVDPVMISKHGAPLMDADAQAALTELLARATLITPNAPEAEALTGRTIRTVTDARRAASELAEPGCSVLLKGGHLEGDAVDVLLHEGTFHELHAERIATRHTHGTGCTYASAITARLARGDDLVGAVHGAKAWLHRAIATAPEFGGGNGPVNHLTPL